MLQTTVFPRTRGSGMLLATFCQWTFTFLAVHQIKITASGRLAPVGRLEIIRKIIRISVDKLVQIIRLGAVSVIKNPKAIYMKSMQIFTGKLVGCLVALTLAAVATNLVARDGTATVIRLQGKARYTTGNNVWLPLRVGDTLRAGTVVQTASESWLDLAFNEKEGVSPQPVSTGIGAAEQRVNELRVERPLARGVEAQPGWRANLSVVRMRENTIMAINRLLCDQTGADTVTEVELDLQKGQILGNVKKLSAASRFEVKFSNGVAGIRGTLFSLSDSGILMVFEGTVVVSFIDPADPTHKNIITVVVNAGEQYDIPNNVKKTIPPGTKPEAPEAAPLLTRPMVYTYGTTPYYISPIARISPTD